jgi:hypothetical protein
MLNNMLLNLESGEDCGSLTLLLQSSSPDFIFSSQSGHLGKRAFGLNRV